MANLMFWNIMKGSAERHLPAACLEHDVDVLVLAEDPSAPGHLPHLLNSLNSGPPYSEVPTRAPNKVRFYTRLPTASLQYVKEDERFALLSYSPPHGEGLLIAAVHLPSKLHAHEAEQYYHARRLRTEIEVAEKNAKHRNTIAIGDFNMSPFEAGMTAADGMHGLMDKNIVSNVDRTYAGESMSFFYNPSWSRMGDESTGPPGTHYYNRGGMINHYWQNFDQILIRPELIPSYEAGSFSILTSVGTNSLLRNDRIDKSISDHLPIVLKLK